MQSNHLRGSLLLIIAYIALHVQACAQTASTVQAPPGTYTTSWVGNSLGGSGGVDGGKGYWVQAAASRIAVSPDGTVFAGVGYEESGRTVGLYKDGHVNLQAPKEFNGAAGSHFSTGFSWGTQCAALCVNGNTFYVANIGKSVNPKKRPGRAFGSPRLIAFSWTPGDINSASYKNEVDLGGTNGIPTGLASRGDVIAVVYAESIELRRTGDLSVTGSISVKGATDVAIAPDKSYWVLANGKVSHYDGAGVDSGVVVPGLQVPVAVAFDNENRLMVCDNGPDQQVKFFTVTGGAPALVKTFGTQHGILSGTPGQIAPTKLFALIGAGTDAQGNIYVGMSFGNQPGGPDKNGPGGNFYLRAFSPAGAERWSLFSSGYLDSYGFDPGTDGAHVYSRTGEYSLDLTKTAPGTEQHMTAITLDPITYPDDPRISNGSSVWVRHLGEPAQTLLYTIGMFGGGFNVYGFSPNSRIAHLVNVIKPSHKYAWDVDDKGGIWDGETGDKINYYPLQSVTDGKPNYLRSPTSSWPWPSTGSGNPPWKIVCRVKYIASTDTLYVTGFLPGQGTNPRNVVNDGLIGETMACYTGWLHGSQTLRWIDQNLPIDVGFASGPHTPKAMDVVGNYVFLVAADPAYKNGPHLVHIYSIADGAYVGAFRPGPAVGDSAGNVDIPFGIQAMQRKNGEYLILVEEDHRAKNILYRWKP